MGKNFRCRQRQSFSWAHIEPKRLVRLSINLGPPEVYTLAGMESDSGAFPLERSLMAFVTSFSEGGSAIVSSTGVWGSLLMASSLMVDGRLMTPFKCSAQRGSIFSLSVIITSPSALRSGDVPDEVGP